MPYSQERHNRFFDLTRIGKILLAAADTIPDDFVRLLVILVGCCSMQSNNRLSEAEEKDRIIIREDEGGGKSG
jgi:hypothetical protein